jgi:steroid delta-isomerase-like uncharacterized protein
MAGGEHLEALVRRFYADVWNRWDDDALLDVLAADFRFRGSLGDEARGPEGFRAYRDRLRAASSDFHNEVVALVAGGDGLSAAVHLRCTGTHRGTLLGIPPTQRRFAYDAAAFFTVRDGRLHSAWVLGDLDGLRRQLSG